MSIHVQVKVQRGHNEFMVTWIPKEFARLGRVLRLKDRDGSWSDGWCVVNTYSELPSKQVIERSQDYKKHRSATDV